MVRFSCNRTGSDGTPVIRDVDIARYAQAVLYDYRPEFFDNYGADYGDGRYYEPEPIDPYDFAERYLGANIDVQDIYTDSSREVIAGAAVFNRQPVKVFDKANMCTRNIIVEPNTILLDNSTVHYSDPFEVFTILHEAGHLLMHQKVYRHDNDAMDGSDVDEGSNAALCKRSRIGGFRQNKGLRTSEDFREHQANTFAASMLMPPGLFMPYVMEQIDRGSCFDDEIMITYTVNDGTRQFRKYVDVVSRTARRFNVSFSSVRVQLKRYGFVATPGHDDEIYEARRRMKQYRSLWK